MRLIKDDGQGGLTLQQYHPDAIPANYAVLSHTWGEAGSEIDYNDFIEDKNKDKSGWAKVDFCKEQAKEDGIQHFWIDTCSIDKRSDTELSTAIRSMYEWYRRATKCYVFLTDVKVYKRRRTESSSIFQWEEDFKSSRWFRRGWTLQELLAPRSVEFFSKDGVHLGSKQSLEDLIHEITEIPVAALRGQRLNDFAVEERFQWARARETSLAEDQAYSLLGIFSVHMPLLYGEGRENALKRLHRKIRKSLNNLDSQAETILSSSKMPLSSISKPPSCETTDSMPTAGRKVDKVVQDGPQRQALMDSLWFDSAEARYQTIQTAHNKTCRWLLEKSEYRDWLDREKYKLHHGLFWIKGKPGSGKSTLMKSIVKDIKKQKTGDVVISFFFNARGEELERSTVGLYRSLIHQLLEVAPDICLPLKTQGESAPSSDSSHPFEEHDLQEMLESVVSQFTHRHLVCFIDALDECEEDEIRNLITFIVNMGKTAVIHQVHLSVCLASRHYPHISIEKGSHLILEGQEGHTKDLVLYLRNELKIGQGPQANEIREEILDRASGIFLWVALVVQILNKEFDHGRVNALLKRLEVIPNGLDQLFEDILTRDQDNLEALTLCLQWILYASRPMRREELYHAILSGNNEQAFRPNFLNVTLQDMDRFILSCSKGLAEMTKQKVPTIQFIHESVRDFLLDSKGLPNLKIDLSPGKSSEILKQCCWNYMQTQINQVIPADRPLPQANSGEAQVMRESITKVFPFMEYAVHNLLFHANVAATHGICQAGFLVAFPREHWIKRKNALERFQIRRYTVNASLLYICAENSLPALIRSLLKVRPPAERAQQRREKERYAYPFCAALASSTISEDTVHSLLFSGEGGSNDDQGERTIVRAMIQKLRNGHHHNVNFRNTEHVINWAIYAANEQLTKIVVEQFEGICTSKDKITIMFHLAVFEGIHSIVRTMLELGFDANTPNLHGENALCTASYKGHERIVRTLLEYGAHVNARHQRGADYEIPLYLASRNGHEVVVQTLIERGAGRKVWALDDAVEAASLGGHEPLMQFLVDRRRQL